MEQSHWHLDERLATTQSSFLKFFEIASFSDVNSTYRNRSNWSKYGKEELIGPASALLNEVPASRNAVLHFISSLVHESVHQHFCERERKGTGRVNATLESAIQTLITKLDAQRIELGPKSKFSMQILKWLFELFSDLCRHNHNRPFFNQQRPASTLLLMAFQQIPCISTLLNLLQSSFITILSIAPDRAIHAFVTAHKNYSTNFDWITIYITDSLPSNFLDQLIKTGADEFQMHCSELANSNPKCVPQLQKEYGDKLRIFIEVLRNMDRNKRVELRNYYLTVIKEFLESGVHFVEIIFLVNLFLFAPEMILSYTDEILNLVIDPRLSERLVLLSQNPSFKLAVSNSSQLQHFIGRLLERASSNSIFNLAIFIAPIIHKQTPSP